MEKNKIANQTKELREEREREWKTHLWERDVVGDSVLPICQDANMLEIDLQSGGVIYWGWKKDFPTINSKVS